MRFCKLTGGQTAADKMIVNCRMSQVHSISWSNSKTIKKTEDKRVSTFSRNLQCVHWFRSYWNFTLSTLMIRSSHNHLREISHFVVMAKGIL